MYTVGQVAKKFSISRSTLLYYDSIGLLVPSGRSAANYRLYSDKDLQLMEKIAEYRSAGLPLEAIANILHKDEDLIDTALETRLFAINSEIQTLRSQQKIILRLLQTENREITNRFVSKDIWVSLFKAAGLDEAGMENWHKEFERTSPQGHQDFLESIGIESTEIDAIRSWSRTEA
jgi:DNA-binding transcriptional MerR regulator